MIKRFKCKNFIYSKSIDITFSKHLTILTSMNGGGKTRLINMIYNKQKNKSRVYKLTMDDIIADEYYDERRTDNFSYLDIQNLTFSKGRGELLELLLNKTLTSSDSSLSCKYDKQMCIFRNNTPITILDLSLGEKILIRLLYELSYKKYDLILIDCIDQLFHIDIQENIIDLIMSIQPNAQLIYTTHSPSSLLHGYQGCVEYIGDYLK